MKQLYIKNGKIVEKRKILIRSGERVIMQPKHEDLIKNGWQPYITDNQLEDIITKAKSDKKNEILKYDSSSEVNEFYINGIPMWLDKNTRSALKLRLEAELAKDKKETVLWYGEISIPISIDLAINMLYELEIYASQCYDVTWGHCANISNLNTIDEIKNYDFKCGYPNKLSF